LCCVLVWLDARTKSTVDNFKAKVPESELEEIRVGLIVPWNNDLLSQSLVCTSHVVMD
jgi:hypothetical protein